MTKKVVTNDGKKGGWLVGKRHYDKEGNSLGGIKAVVTDAGGKPVELEGGEVIINREASKKHWKELSRINQSAGNGVAIEPPAGAFDEDPSEDYEKGGKIEFNANHIPNKWILNYAIKVKAEHKDVWDLGGNIFGNQAFINLKRVAERGYWLDSEEWMYKKWRSYVARHQGDFRIEGVIAMLKWVDKVDKGWQYMKNLIEEEIKKRESRKSKKMNVGGNVNTYNKGDVWRINSVDYYFDESYIDDNGIKKWKTYKVFSTARDRYTGTKSIILSKTITDKRLKEFADVGKKYGMDVTDLFVIKYNDGGNVDDSNILTVSKYILNRHPKNGDVLRGGKYQDYEIVSTRKVTKAGKVSFKLWLKKGINRRIVTYTPQTKKISDFIKVQKGYAKGFRYDEWSDGPIGKQMNDGGNVGNKNIAHMQAGGWVQKPIKIKPDVYKFEDHQGVGYIVKRGVGDRITPMWVVSTDEEGTWDGMNELFYTKKAAINYIESFFEKGDKMNNGGNLSKTPSPASERIKGSKFNAPGTAKDSKSGASIKFDENTLASIKSLIDEHNEKHPSKKITLSVAKAVVRRGMGAYSGTHRPTITGGKPNSRTAWGLARLNAFIYKAQNGKSKSGRYTQDDDLLAELGINVSKYAKGGGIGKEIPVRVDYLEQQLFENNKDIQVPKSVYKEYSKSGKVPKDIVDDLSSEIDEKHWVETTPLSVHLTPLNKMAKGGLIAPNGKPSNLTPEQYDLVRTPEFKAWFGDWENDPQNSSKVVDENGEPLVVYRGDSSASKKGFVFKTGFNRMSYISKDRLPNQYFHYFVDNYEVALGYGKNQIEDHNEKVAETGKGKLWEAKVTPYFLNIKNPIDITPNNSLFPTFSEYEKLQEKINGKAHVYRNSYDYGFYITQAELNKILENKLGADYLENTKETAELYSRVDEWAKESFRKTYYPEKTFAYFIEYKGSNSRSDILRRIYLKMLKNNVDGMVFLESTNWETDFFENWRKYESGELKYDSKRWVEKPKVFAALESNQIKLADGSNTTFDANNQDIRYDDGGNINFGKVSSASSRFRPSETIVFDPPLLGPNGNKLISYTWKYEWTTDFSIRTGDEIEKRVSDWSQAELSADTGRNIVHSFTIVKPNGESLSVSSESVPIVMGFVSKEQKKDFSNLATASKTLAKQQMQLSILEAQQKEFEEIKQSIIDAGYPEIEIKPWYSDEQVKLVMGDGSAVADANNPYEKERIEVLKESYVRGELAKLGIDWYRSNNSYQISELKKRIERQKRKVENITESSKMEDGGNVDIFNFTSYEDAQIWMKQKAKDYSNQNQFYASEEYKLAYPIIMQLYEIEKSSYVQKSKVAMKESGVNYGDRVIYDYITPFLNSEKYSGVLVERNGLPYVKLDEGQQTMSGAKSTRWHKGWKKQTSNFENGGNLDAKDSVTIDIPLMIRLLELSREDVKSDAELHFVVENLLKLKNKPVLTMDDYAFIADVEHNHLKKYDLGGKMPEAERTVDLGFGGLGNGTTVWDRNRIHNNDYKIVAHISNEGKITYYDKKLPEYAINQIESMAENEKKRYEDMNGLSTGYDFNPIQTPLN